MSLDILDELTEEDFKSLQQLAQTEGYKTLKRIGEEIFPKTLGLSLVDLDLSSKEDIKKVQLNQLYVKAVGLFIGLVEQSTPAVATQTMNDEFINPNYETEYNPS